MVELTEQALKEAKLKAQDTVVTVLGVAYLENSDDTRNSPAKPIIDALKNKGVKVRVHDPFVKDFEDLDLNDNLNEALGDSDCLVLVTAHTEYKSLSLDHLKKILRTPIIIDGRNVFDKDECTRMGFIYYGIGK
jgi:UDP-N-acetyl-D-mannosaminuronic acid dehydrogenase